MGRMSRFEESFKRSVKKENRFCEPGAEGDSRDEI